MKSYGKNHDRKNRILLMENMAVMMRMYGRTREQIWLDRAAEMGILAKKLSERIKNHDYTQEDTTWEEVTQMGMEAKKLWREMTKNVPEEKITPQEAKRRWTDEVNRRADRVWEELLSKSS